MHNEILESSELLDKRAADIIQDEIAHAGSLALGLAGGSTPAGVYRVLAERPIDWSTTTTWITDERWVGPTHEHANQDMARRTLAGPTGVQLLAPDTTMESPDQSAQAFDATLRSLLTPGMRMVTLLGIGTDGHTASLFPGTDALEATDSLYVANHVRALDTWRLTATFELIARSHVVLFIVSGASKASIVGEIAAGNDVPAARVSATERVLWLLDEQAAGAL